MLIHLFSNYSIDPDATATVAFYKDEETKKYNLYLNDAEMPFQLEEESIEKIRAHLKACENYHWLFNNIAVNVEKVSANFANYKTHRVELYHEGGKTACGPFENDEEMESTYKRYVLAWNMQHARKLQRQGEFNAAASSSASGAFAKDLLPPAGKMTVEAAREDIGKMIGCDRAKREIDENMAYMLLAAAKKEMGIEGEPISRHMAYLGNPGTGKTTFARKVAALYHAAGIIAENKVIEVTRKDLVEKYVGHTAKKTEEVIARARGGILFIDEAYDLLRASDDNKDFGQEVINTLVPAMENMRDDLIVILAGYPDEIADLLASNPGLQSRCANMVTFEDYTMPELRQIMEQMLERRGLSMTPEAAERAVNIIDMAKAATEPRMFANARTVRNLIEQAEKALALRLQAEGKLPLKKGDAADMRSLLTIQPSDIKDGSIDIPVRKHSLLRNTRPFGHP